MYEYVCFHSILYEASKSIVKLDHHLLACKKPPKKPKNRKSYNMICEFFTKTSLNIYNYKQGGFSLLSFR